MLPFVFFSYAPTFINRLHVHLLRYIGIAQGVEMVHCILAPLSSPQKGEALWS